MTIEKHIERIKQKYSDNINLQLAKLWSLGLQLGLGYGAKQLIKQEIDKLYAQGAVLDVFDKHKRRKVNDYSFNTNTIGGGLYDDLLKQIKNGQPTQVEHSHYNKPVTVKIQQMSPTEYVRQCARIMGTSESVLRQSREDGSMNRLQNLDKSTTFNLPYIDYVKGTQDGLHRAIVAEKNGTTKIPVLVVSSINDVSIAMEKYAEIRYKEITSRINELDAIVDRYDNSGRNVPASIYEELESLNKELSQIKSQLAYIFDEEVVTQDKLIQSSSQEAFNKNMRTEINTGKSQKQAAAIAYSVQRKNDAKLLDDQIASNSGELTNIINKWLSTNPGLKSEVVQIKGNILTGNFKLFINGRDVLVNYNPTTGGILQEMLKVNRSSNTVNQSDVNNMIRKFYENTEKVKQAQLMKTPPKLLYVIIEFTESDYYGLASKVGRHISVDEAEKLIKNADEARRNDKNKVRGTYDKTYVDVVIEWGEHKYRIHFLRFDVGDGAQYMNVKQQVDNLLKRVPDFMTNASYRGYMKQIDAKPKNFIVTVGDKKYKVSAKDANNVVKYFTKCADKDILLREYRNNKTNEFAQLFKHNGGFTFSSTNPQDDKDFTSIVEAENYIKYKNYNKL